MGGWGDEETDGRTDGRMDGDTVLVGLRIWNCLGLGNESVLFPTFQTQVKKGGGKVLTLKG